MTNFNKVMKRLFKKIYTLITPIALTGIMCINSLAQTVDNSVVYVTEERGLDCMQISSVTDYVCMPEVRRNSRGVSWYSNSILDVSNDGTQIAYLSYRNNTTNIFVKSLHKQGTAIQRTNRTSVIDFSYSPDGKYIVFSEMRGKTNTIFQTPATSGSVCRQITGNNKDYTPIYSSDMSKIFFARQENNNISIWSYDTKNNFLANYTQGCNPFPVKKESAFVCTRTNAAGNNEIWKINYETGVEECIVSHPDHNFSTPSISPDGEWMVFVGSTKIESGRIVYYNTDLFVARMDGSDFTQLTYHAADDISPTWSYDGRHIYFISQRGSADNVANIWRITFRQDSF